MFNVMDEKAPFLRVRETYSGLRNCAVAPVLDTLRNYLLFFKSMNQSMN